MTHPPVRCSYAARPLLRKVWLVVGTTRRLFEIGLLENFIHYGLDTVQDRPDSPDTLSLLNPWARPYKSPEDELSDAPCRLPKSMRMGLLEILPKLHQRGFLIFHDEALNTQPRRAKTHQPGYPVMNAANLALWYRQVMQHGDWRLTPEATHLLTAAKAWLTEQPLFGNSGALPWFHLGDEPLPQGIVDKVVAHVATMGATAEIKANKPLPPGKSGLAGPHLAIEHEPLPGTYWLKQEPRAEEKILEGVWKILEAEMGNPTRP